MPVVDTSVVLTFMLNEPDADAALALLGGGDLHAPDILPVEIANALINALRRGRITERDARQLLHEAADIPIVLHPSLPLLPAAMDLALRQQRRPFDCLFVVLAEQLQMPVITTDEKLIRGLVGSSSASWVKPLVG